MHVPTLQQGFDAARAYLLAPTNPHARDARVVHEDPPHALLGSYLDANDKVHHETGILVVDPETLRLASMKHRFLKLLLWRDADRVVPGTRFAVVFRCGVTEQDVRTELLHLDRHRETFMVTFAERKRDAWRIVEAPKL